MKYKLFFAYQTDIPVEYGKDFIQRAIEKAKIKLKKSNIDLEIDFGCRATPGNPILIQEMLDKSNSSDLVLVDLTFTSSKNRLDGKKISLWKKELHYSNKTEDDKKSPNPNVLLETGFAWSKKGYNRTIMLMNTCFGNPDELPVDLKSFRWPIQFNFSKINIDKKETIFEELTNDLFIAIKTAVLSDATYQIDRWRPFDTHSEWEKKHSYPYKLTPKLKTKLLEVRDNLIDYKSPLRIIGKKDCGKTRLVLELLKKNGDINKHELINSILYFDLFNTNYSSIQEKIHELKRLEQIKIVVIDNCDEQTHIRLKSDFELSNIRLITIDTIESDFDKLTDYIYFEEQIALEVNKEIINERFTRDNVTFIADKIGKSTKNLITILRKDIDGYNNTNNFIFNYLSQFGLIEKSILEYINFLSLVSVFGVIGISNQYKSELEEIRIHLMDESITEQSLDTIIKNLIEFEILKYKGDFIYIDVFVEDFIQIWWKQNKEQLEQLILKISDLKLFDKFTENLIKVIENPEYKLVKESVFESDSLLKSNDFVNTFAGELLLNKLSEKFPNEVLIAMSNKINKL